jgi:hypothetical protein
MDRGGLAIFYTFRPRTVNASNAFFREITPPSPLVLTMARKRSTSAPTAATSPTPPGALRTRNKGIRRVRVADLEEHPGNYRTHPTMQADALAGTVEEIGWYGYPDVYETADGKLRLTDGHLRKSFLLEKYGPDAEVDVNVTDFDETEAKAAMLTKDPLAALAEHNTERLNALLSESSLEDGRLAPLLEQLAGDAQAEVAQTGGSATVMPEKMALQPYEHYDYVLVVTKTFDEWTQLCEKLGLEKVNDTKPGAKSWKKVGMGRAIWASQLLSKLP